MYGQQKRNIIHTSSTAYEQDYSAAAHNPRAATRADPMFAEAWYNLSDLLDEQAASHFCVTTLDTKRNPQDSEKIAQLTLEHYNQYAEEFWQGTRDRDVSQNIAALISQARLDSAPKPTLILNHVDDQQKAPPCPREVWRRRSPSIITDCAAPPNSSPREQVFPALSEDIGNALRV
jgi:hypothetical protein